MSHKVIAINSFWASIIASLMVALVLGGVSYALAAGQDLAVIQDQMQEIRQAKLMQQFPVVQEQVKQIQETTKRMEVQQEKITDKLERILQQTRHK